VNHTGNEELNQGREMSTPPPNLLTPPLFVSIL